MQIAIAMAIDLGLNQSLRPLKEQEMGFDLAHRYSSDEDLHSTEARRAYIGCYYLSVLYGLWFTLLGVSYVQE